MQLRLVFIAAAAFLLAVLLGGCGDEDLDRAKEGSTEGAYLRLGQLSYQVQLSRQLNPFDAEDGEYLMGIEERALKLSEDQILFGVWMRVENREQAPDQAADQFTISDTQHEVYRPIEVPPDRNPFIYHPENVPPKGTIPVANTAAASGPTTGKLLLFKIKLESLQSRPLSLRIGSSHAAGRAKVDLDV